MMIVAALRTLIHFGVVSYRFFLPWFFWCYVFVQILEGLLKHPENRECADCKTKYCFCRTCEIISIMGFAFILYSIFFAEVQGGLVLTQVSLSACNVLGFTGVSGYTYQRSSLTFLSRCCVSIEKLRSLFNVLLIVRLILPFGSDSFHSVNLLFFTRFSYLQFHRLFPSQESLLQLCS